MSSQKKRILAIYQANSNSELSVDSISKLTKIKRKTVQGRISELAKSGNLIKIKECTYKFRRNDNNEY